MRPDWSPGMPSKRTWWTLLLLALVLRLAHAPLLSLHHPDELWQYQEPAYHLAAGPWVRTWEWRFGIRSWFYPMLLAGPMWLGLKLAPGTMLYILLPRLMMVAISLGVVAAAIRLGARISRTHAVLAGFVAAIWFECVYFAPRTLSEPFAVALFLGAAALLLDGSAQTRRRMGVAGALLGLMVMVRFQCAPAALVLALGIAWRRPAALVPLALGGIAACLLASLADVAMGQAPLRWIWANVDQNIVANRSAHFGVSGPFGFFEQLATVWSWAAILLAPLALLGARRYPVLAATALVHFALHSAIPHKEYRFILLTTVLLVLLAAIGTVDLIAWIGARRSARWQGRVLAGAMAGWFVVSVVTAAVLPFHHQWGAHGAILRAFAIAQQAPRSCGIALYGRLGPPIGAWTYYNRPAPMFSFGGARQLAVLRAHGGAFDTLLAPADTPVPPGNWTFHGCSEPIRAGERPPSYCIWHRSGGCHAPAPAPFEMNAVMERYGF